MNLRIFNNMKKFINNIKSITSIDILAIIAFGLYGLLLINTLLKWI